MLISFQLRTNRNLPYKLDVFLVYWRRRMKLWMKVLSFCIIFAFMHSTCQIRDLSLCKFIQKFHGHWTYRFVNIRCNNLTFLLHFLSQLHSVQWLGAGGRCLVCLWFVTQLPPTTHWWLDLGRISWYRFNTFLTNRMNVRKRPATISVSKCWNI